MSLSAIERAILYQQRKTKCDGKAYHLCEVCGNLVPVELWKRHACPRPPRSSSQPLDDLDLVFEALEAYGNRHGTEEQGERCVRFLEQLFDMCSIGVQTRFLNSDAMKEFLSRHETETEEETR